MSLNFDVTRVREHFPSVIRPRAPIYFDNPAGTQVTGAVADGVRDYLLFDNANHGGAFATSTRSNAMVNETRAAMADFLGANSPDEIVFGPNMTTLTYGLSRALGRTLRPGDEIVVTRLDHDSNIAPWVALEECGAVVRWVDVHTEDCTLDFESLAAVLGPRTKLVAVGLASNAVGTVNDVSRIVRMAHAVDARVFVDAVHFAPHGPIDVAELDCDFLSCSVYKFFGPHLGVLWGRRELLERLPAYKVRSAPDAPPDRFETGTQNHEGIAGTLEALHYLEWLGNELAPAPVHTRRARLLAAMHGIRARERELSHALLQGLQAVPGLRIFGITDPDRMGDRVPTFSFTLAQRTPLEVATHLASRDIQAWNGNHFAMTIMETLGLEQSGGTVRVGAVHYNTHEEIDLLVQALHALT
ncbi:MAG TPA: cysteine desulfurase-like protein [Candidatus Krumholzibacteria bacterium]|nr:cysteine desulfurase-like protein [Candidatus Krumholzibacteria bacterium]